MNNRNIQMIETVAKAFGKHLEEFVFVGGATVSLYLDKGSEGISRPRPTNDVDCIVEVTTRPDFYKLENRLRSMGFKNYVADNAPLCRWQFQQIIVDVMPIHSDAIGFSNPWYPSGFQDAQFVKFPSGIQIKILTAPYFIATKLSAFEQRGKNDFLASSDLEDIITVLSGRASIGNEIDASPAKLRNFLKANFSRLYNSERFKEGLVGHLPKDLRNERGVTRILKLISHNNLE